MTQSYYSKKKILTVHTFLTLFAYVNHNVHSFAGCSDHVFLLIIGYVPETPEIQYIP